MTQISTLFLLLLSATLVFGRLHPTDQTTKRPIKGEPMEEGKTFRKDRDRQQRSVGSQRISECQEGNPPGASYSGKMNVTTSGRACQAWSAQDPHEHSNTEVGEHNLCRNPDGDPGGVWCYTTDPDKRWEHCSVPICAPKMMKVLDFSTDTDHEPDSNDEYTRATLEAGPLPESFTVCSAFIVEAWTTEFTAAYTFTLLDNDGYTWGRIKLFAAYSYTEYSVWLGPVKFINQTETVFFPLQWSRACLSLDSVAGKVTIVVDGQLLGEEEYKKDEDWFRPDSISLVLGFDPDTEDERWNTGSIADVNIFSSSMSLEGMIAQSTAGGEECGHLEIWSTGRRQSGPCTPRQR